MKRFIMALLVLMFWVSPVFGQTWHLADQVSVTWDAVTTMNDDGTPIPAGDTVTYSVYTVPRNDSKDNAVFSQATSQTVATVTLPSEGWYFVGIQTVRLPEGETEAVRSSISWSDNPVYCRDGATFGFKFFFTPDNASNIERVANRE